MVVVKHNGTIYIARSCWGFKDNAARKNRQVNCENFDVWHPEGNENRLMAVMEGNRFTDLLRYEDVFPEPFDPKPLVLESYDKIYKLAERFDLCDNYELPCRVVFAENDRALLLLSEGGCFEIEDVYSDLLDDNAVFALSDFKGMSEPYEFIKEVYTAVEDVRNYVMFPVVVMNTKSNEITIIER